MDEESIHQLYWGMLLAINVSGLVSELLGLGLGYYLILAVSIMLIARSVYRFILGSYDATNTFMSIVAVVLLYMNYYFEAFIIFILYSASEFIEELSEKIAKRKLRNLFNLIPKKVVKVFGSNDYREVELSEVSVGDVILVRPGEVVPVDGVVVDGSSEIDTSVITGEPIPITVKSGDSVEGGYINKSSPIKIKVMKPVEESMLHSIVREIKKSLESKGFIERFIDSFSKPYTLIVLAIFAFVFMVYDPYRALAILIATCPSAFIVSSSISTTLSIAKLSTRGVVIRGSAALESAKKVKAIAFDKTGTLTVGSPKVINITPLNGFDRDTVVSYASSLARFSTHPISKAIASLGGYVECSFVKEYPGMGIEGLINGSRVLLGNMDLAKKFGLNTADLSKIDLGSGIKAYLYIGDRIAGVFVLDDQIKEDARNVITNLKSLGFKIILISGDVMDRVKRVASELGIDEYYYGMKPDTKLNVIRKLKAKYGSIAMVGDGINDAPSLAESDFGIAVGRYAIVAEVADAVVLSRLRNVIDIFRIAHTRWGSLITSFIIILIIKGLALFLGLTGLIPLWIVALIGDDGSTLIGLAPLAKLLSRS